MPQLWQVVGGGDKGGILIREGPTTATKSLGQRLATGAIVEELETKADKLHFKKVTGEGPDEGWATIKLPDKDLLIRIDADAPPGEEVEPVDIEARCTAEWAKPPVRWDSVGIDALERAGNKAKGKIYGMEFPWDGDTVKAFGPKWMTEAFQAAGSIPPGVKVTAIKDVKKYVGGGACSKLWIDVAYSAVGPGLHNKLFAKIPFPLTPDTKSDRMAQSVMTFQGGELGEINVSRLLESKLPFRIPKYYFGDFSNETTNWILITERIPFSPFSKKNLEPFEIEPPYEKMMDWNLRGPEKEYYYTLLLAGAKMAGMYKAGGLGPTEKIDDTFGNQNHMPAEAWGMHDGPTGLGASEYRTKLKLGAEFVSVVAKAVLGEELTTPAMVETYKRILTTVNAYKQEIMFVTNMEADYTAWSHGNLNVDNSFFWRDADGKLDVGVLDLNGNCSSIGRNLWWWLYGCEPEFLAENVDELLEYFIKVFHENGGPMLELKKLKLHFILHAMDQGVGLLGAVPQIYRMCKKKEWPNIKDRRDPRISENIDGKNTLRLYVGGFVMMMTLIKAWKVEEWVEEFVNMFTQLSGKPRKEISFE